MIPVVTPEQMRAIDAAAPESVTTLIERAGAAVARTALRMLGGAYGRQVVVIAGPGNNGADGRVAADRLRERGVRVRVVDATSMPDALPTADLVIDAAFGTGFRGTWASPDVGRAQVLAVDVPTGLDALTGAAGPSVLAADVTVTFAAAKPGHVLGDGPDLVGEIEIADIGLPVDDTTIGIVDAGDVAAWWPRRGRRSHKWSDAVRVVAGSDGMTGAAALSAAAAQRTGAGMVVLSSPGVDADAPVEVVRRPLNGVEWSADVLADLYRFHALVIGPGLGRSDQAVASVVRSVVGSVVPVVVDGDGLFALSWNDEGTPSFLCDHEVPVVLTPHDGEFAQLTGAAPGNDRIDAAARLVEMSGAVVLLKGPTTVVASTGAPTLLVTNGDQRLATAGTGDVLAGIIGALIAGGTPPANAAAAGAWLHAEAARVAGANGLVASDLLTALPTMIDELIEGSIEGMAR